MKRDSLYCTSIYLPIHETCSFVSAASKGVSSEVSSKSAGDIQPGQNKFMIEIIIIGLKYRFVYLPIIQPCPRNMMFAIYGSKKNSFKIH